MLHRDEFLDLPIAGFHHGDAIAAGHGNIDPPSGVIHGNASGILNLGNPGHYAPLHRIEYLNCIGLRTSDHHLAVGQGHLTEARIARQINHRHLLQLGIGHGQSRATQEDNKDENHCTKISHEDTGQSE